MNPTSTISGIKLRKKLNAIDAAPSSAPCARIPRTMRSKNRHPRRRSDAPGGTEGGRSEAVRTLSAATQDICEYVVRLSKAHGLASGLAAIAGGVTLHHACHARAQNMGAKSAEMLRLIPDTKVDLVERCSGHGGTFGIMKETRPLAMKVGKPAARQVAQKGNETLCSDCPLACKHLGELVSADLAEGAAPPHEAHPIEVLARAYGL